MVTEDFTTYTEVDNAYNRIKNILPSSFNVVNIPYGEYLGAHVGENSYLVKDFGVNWWDGDYEHYITVNAQSALIIDDHQVSTIVWCMSTSTVYFTQGAYYVELWYRTVSDGGTPNWRLSLTEGAGGTDIYDHPDADPTIFLHYVGDMQRERPGVTFTVMQLEPCYLTHYMILAQFMEQRTLEASLQ